ncbi:HAD family hydrolase [Allofournierella sp.]|uniref:HAD family hydrolase n=1 Tax=Allofournierella sp. TaxID=1940256 RepID=UPI003AB38BBC
MLKAVIFDFDYTLGDSTNGIALSINYALRELGYAPPNISDIKKSIGLSLTETYFTLTSNDDLDEAGQFAKLFKEKADSVMVAHTTLYAGVKNALQMLKDKGRKTAIVTTKFHYRIEQILNKFSLSELIDIIVGAEDVKAEKPDPEGLLWAIEHLDVRNKEVLYVGDSLVDAKTAENAKVDFVAVLTGTKSRDDFKNYNCTYIGEDIADICKYILTLE